MQSWVATQAMLGGAFSIALRLLERELDGRWAMARESTFGKISGFQLQPLTKLSPLRGTLVISLWFHPSLMRIPNGGSRTW